MTEAEEKAEELIDEFYQTTPNEAWVNEPIGLAKSYTASNQAKQCAIICATEMLNQHKEWNEHSIWNRMNFWQEVLNHLKK